MTPRQTELDERLMREALVLAANGRGHVEPNPMVGCIIHRQGRIIGRGFHAQFGGPHAEPAALANCIESPSDATAVVTLEPCCHTNKKTPPCVPALIAAKISRVVIGQIDPNPSVAGKGAQQLSAAGIDVTTGVLESHCQQLNAAFFALMKLHRPYITLKWAQSADGCIGGPNRTPRRISSPESTQLIHLLRTRCDAIAVSADTVICDDPSLTVRHVPIIRTPLRIILDTNLRTPPSARLLQTPPETLIFTSSDIRDQRSEIRNLKSEIDGLRFLRVPRLAAHLDLQAVLLELGKLNLTHLLIEPGERLGRALLDQGLWDRLWIIHSPNRINDPTAPRAPSAPAVPIAMRTVGPDTVDEYLNSASPAFFAPIPSPDFSLR